MNRGITIGLNAVIAAVTEGRPRVLTIARADSLKGAPSFDGAPTPEGTEQPVALPFGPLDPVQHRTLELGVRDWVREQAGLELGYVEQLYTFADRDRDPRERLGGPRAVSIAYLALVREGEVAGVDEASWRDIYEFFPWEDWREGRPHLMERVEQELSRWERAPRALAARRQRRERVDLCFGLGGAGWDGYQVLERYELLYEARLVLEAWRDAGDSLPRDERRLFGRPMVLDHRRILATALARLRGKLKYRPVVFELLPEAFTLLQLQRVVEALAGVQLHKQNFRRLVEKGRLVEGTGTLHFHTGGRPAELFRFRREVLRERLAPGVGAPSPQRTSSGR